MCCPIPTADLTVVTENVFPHINIYPYNTIVQLTKLLSCLFKKIDIK